MKIKAVRCLKCGDIIYSRAHYDFHWCGCKSCAVDGGFDYMKITGNREDWEFSEVSILEGKGADEVKRILYDDWNGRKNKYGTIRS